MAVVVLSSSGFPTGQIAQDIAAVLVQKYADTLRVRRAQQPAGGAGGGGVAQQPSKLDELNGEWSGTLRTWKATLPLRVSVRPEGEVFVWLGNQPRAVMNQAAFRNNRLSGRFAGQIPTDDAGRWAHSIAVALQLVDGTLKGQLSAQTSTDVVYYSLASYAELKKQ
jgi:hypothetical protein